MNTQVSLKKSFCRFFSVLLSFVMFCSMFVGVLDFTSFETSAFDPTSYSIPTSGTTDSYKFKATPAVYEMGDGYAVIWATTFKGTGYIEILGAGMVHPNVLKMAGIDPTRYHGFAWGGGMDRLVMLKYGLDDVRYFESGNLNFLKEF